MAIYLVSDVHGDYNALIKLLQQVAFSKSDELYILGDIADRGPDFYKIYKYVRSNENIHLLMGNHEHSLMKVDESMSILPPLNYEKCMQIAKYVEDKYESMMFESFNSIARECGKENLYNVFRNEIIPYIKDLPLYAKIELNGKKYLLVHAGVNYKMPLIKQTRNNLLWDREPFNFQDLPFEDCIVVHGHTPTQLLSPQTSNGEVLIGKHKISIDGGAATNVTGRLNLLRLDDMQVFSVPSKRIEKDFEVIK